jgi:hypothetical protein
MPRDEAYLNSINLISPTSAAGAAPAVSTESSAAPEQDFSVLLAELAGPDLEKQAGVGPQIIPLASISVQPEVAGFSPRSETDGFPGSESVVVPRREAPKPAIELQMSEVVGQFTTMADAITPFRQIDSPPQKTPQEMRVAEVPPSLEPAEEPLAAEILQDLKKIEITIKREIVEAPKPAVEVQMPAQPRQPVITTDAIANLQQTELTPPAIPQQAVKPAIELQIAAPLDQSGIARVAIATLSPSQLTSRAIPPERVLGELNSSGGLKIGAVPAAAASATSQPLPAPIPFAIVDRAEETNDAPESEPAIVLHRQASKAPIELQFPEPAKQPVMAIATDAIVNLKETPLTPRAIPLAGVLAGIKTADRAKNGIPSAGTNDSAAAASASQFADPGRMAADTVEQVRPAQPVEIPDMPKLQTVRTVAMEVGEGGSQVVVRIEDRGGGVNLHFGTGDETLHRSIATSVESLVHALKEEKIEISNVEIFRKSPIDKVRRMKEAH